MIEQQKLFPGYIPREQEKQIQRLAAQVRADRRSRAALLYGPGGVGKTVLVRHLAESAFRDNIIWLEPIDVDDSEYWLLSNLERAIAEKLSPKGGYFKEYLEYSTQLPRFEQARLGHETVLAHLRRGAEVFRRCYEQFIIESGWMPVITLDTVEAIRGTDMLLSLTQWMKRLPGTLFILAGRPMHEDIHHDDPVIQELKDPHQNLPFEKILLAGFTMEETLQYFANSGIASALSSKEQEKLALLTQGHPLWLALTVDYLVREGMPQEVRDNSIEQLQKWLPYQAELPPEGKRLHEEFLRHLVVPYRETGFWNEAIKRLAVVRQRVNQSMWVKLMADLSLPKDIATWQEAWDLLLKFPWIRPRANRHYITLHDALAEELARRIIPLHDKEETWRQRQWQVATQIYVKLTQNLERKLRSQWEALDEALQPDLPAKRQRKLVEQVAQLDTQKRELDQLKAAHLYYQMLGDFEVGCREFINLFDQATNEHEFRFRELLWLEMQRFLPSEVSSLEDVIRPVVERFQHWFLEHPNVNYEIELRGAHYLLDSGRSQEADSRLIGLLSKFKGDLEREYRLYILRGNARMRIPGQIRNAEEDFRQALVNTRHPAAPEPLKLCHGQALKELGFYYRQTGDWTKASEAYFEALRVTPLQDQEERASIQSNWAYVQALRGRYQEALDLVEAALTVRRRRDLRRGVGMALSIKGEVYRYARDFVKAWQAYQEAESIFQELGDWPWLGLIRQEQAICLFQADQTQQFLTGYENSEQMLQAARSLALQALDLCRDRSIRAYPSALNRAGRIFGYDDPEKGIEYIEEGIRWAKEVADGWFWFANLIEFIDLNYKIGDLEHRTRIEVRAPEVEEVKVDYDFPDLSGRWELLQGHLKVCNALTTTNQEEQLKWLSQALEHYKRGFPLLTKGFVGSHGAHGIPGEFKRFIEILGKLPVMTRDAWCKELQRAWGDPALGYIEEPKQSTSLLARLTEVYETLVAQPSEGPTAES